MLPIDAAVIPLPTPDNTPPVTNIYLVSALAFVAMLKLPASPYVDLLKYYHGNKEPGIGN
jgi:hypothetical protein